MTSEFRERRLWQKIDALKERIRQLEAENLALAYPWMSNGELLVELNGLEGFNRYSAIWRFVQRGQVTINQVREVEGDRVYQDRV